MTDPSPDTHALGRAVRAIRDDRGISQMRLAAATGFVQSWLSQVENGQRNVSWSNLVRLGDGLGVGVAELAARAEAMAGETKSA